MQDNNDPLESLLRVVTIVVLAALLLFVLTGTAGLTVYRMAGGG